MIKTINKNQCSFKISYYTQAGNYLAKMGSFDYCYNFSKRYRNTISGLKWYVTHSADSDMRYRWWDININNVMSFIKSDTISFLLR